MIAELKRLSRELKQNIAALYLALRRRDVPWYTKAIIAMVVGYALSPIDLIPDFIPVLGYLDDLLIVPLGILLAIRLLPANLLQECKWEAEGLFQGGKPRNWIAGAVIIAIWVFAGIYFLVKVMTRQS